MKNSKQLHPRVETIRVHVHVQKDGKKSATIFVNGEKEIHIPRTTRYLERASLKALSAMNFVKGAKVRERISTYCERKKIPLTVVAARQNTFTTTLKNGTKVLYS